MELAERTIEEIRNLRFDSDAQIITALDSIGTVYWSDEIPEEPVRAFLTESEAAQVRRLFMIRERYWNTGTMGYQDQLYWQESQRQFPDWPVFQRLELSVEQREKQQGAEEIRQYLMDIVMSQADELRFGRKAE